MKSNKSVRDLVFKTVYWAEDRSDYLPALQSVDWSVNDAPYNSLMAALRADKIKT